ncbi:MAG: sodium:proton antiporter [Alphaproteobacteria bacterium]|nr:sodium:proton antiporter [Alphaproteobacteria bacterium]
MDPAVAADPTFLSLVPALVAIALAFATRQVVPALFLGIVSGSLVLWYQTGDASKANFISEFFLPALGSKGYAKILLIYLWSLGGLLGLWEKTGGALHFARVVGARVAKGPRSSMFFGWILGCVFHQGGTVSTVLAGTTVKPVADAHKVSHEELSYIVDSTASPVATVLPFNAWPAYVAALVAGTIPLIADEKAGAAWFLEAIPFNFYALFAVIGTLLFAFELVPVFGKMKRARVRARTTGALDAPDSKPMLPSKDPGIDPTNAAASGYAPSLLDFLVPIGVLLGMAVIPYVLGRLGVLENGDWINEAFLCSVLSAMAVAFARGMKVGEIIDGFVEGCRSMTIGAIVLGLAVTIGTVTKQLDTAAYLVSVMGDAFPMVALPALLMGLCMFIAFATGSSWGTYAVVFPVALPLAYAVNPDPTYLHICFGAVLGGAVFGDQCSPISDTTILSSMFTGCDLMDHVNTQMPLALGAAALGAIASTVSVVLLV